MEKNKAIRIYTLLWGMIFLLLGSRIIVWDSEELFIRGFSQWLDYPVHFAFSRAMENLWPWEILKSHPYFSWTPFNYYFIPDLFVTFLLKIKVRFDWAILLPTVTAFVLYIHQKTIFLFKKGFTLKGVLISDFLFLFLGGFGFVLFALFPSEFGITNNFELSSFYVNAGTLFSSYYSNPLAGQIFSSKNIVFGLGLFFFCLNLLEEKSYRALFFAILLFPFVHAHSFVIFMLWWGGTTLFLHPKRYWRDYLWLVLTSLVCFLVLKLTLLKYSGSGFLQWRFGWRSSPFDFETYKVLIIGTGLFWPLALFSFYKNFKIDFFRKVAFFSFLVLGLTHFIQWQPNIWDNIKIYNFAHLFASLSLGFFLASLVDIKNIVVRLTTFLLLLCLTFNGVFENFLIYFTDRHLYPFVTKSDLKLSEEFQKKYEGGKVYYENFHHHWYPILIGKNIALGFKYNLWTWGVPYQSYLQTLAPLLKGDGETTDHQRLGIHYVIASKMDLLPPKKNEAHDIYDLLSGSHPSFVKAKVSRTMYPEKARNFMPFFYIGTGDVPEVNISYYRSHYPVFLENRDWVIFDVTRKL